VLGNRIGGFIHWRRCGGSRARRSGRRCGECADAHACEHEGRYESRKYESFQHDDFLNR
jgi:hypothetical protein